VLDVSVHDTVRTELIGKLTDDVGHETVIPGGKVGDRVTFPLKFNLAVRVTFNKAPVWPTFRSCPAVDIEKSPTLTVNEKERLRVVDEREPFIVTV
jgi:hypothetical protein